MTTDLSDRDDAMGLSVLRTLSPEFVLALERFVDERVKQRVDILVGAEHKSMWLSVAASAEYCGLSARTIQRLVAKGLIRSSTVGRRRLLYRDDLDGFMRGDGGGEARTAPPRRRRVE
ncbi:MAG: excisionase family DNA-binding protein [Gaiella sp.]